LVAALAARCFVTYAAAATAAVTSSNPIAAVTTRLPRRFAGMVVARAWTSWMRRVGWRGAVGAATGRVIGARIGTVRSGSSARLDVAPTRSAANSAALA